MWPYELRFEVINKFVNFNHYKFTILPINFFFPEDILSVTANQLMNKQ